MRVFDNRNTFQKYSVNEFKDWISKQKDLQALDYEQFVDLAFKEKRKYAVDYIQAIFPYHHSIFDMQVNDRLIFSEICASGTARQIKTLLTFAPDLKKITGNGICLFTALGNRIKSQESTECLEITKLIIEAENSLVDSKMEKPLIAAALQKSQFETAVYLVQKGADCGYISENGENLLHLLMRKYSKTNEKIILQLRNLLLDRDVDEDKKNSYYKKPLDLCPELKKKVEQESKKRAKNNEEYKKTKGKSEQGWETARKNNEEKMAEKEGVIYLKLQTKFDQIQIQKQANMIIEKHTQEKEKELKKMKLEKEKDKEFKNRVMTPDELKYYLEEDIRYETELIEEENKRQRTFLNQLVDNITFKINKQLGADIRIFGSFATELCLPESDIDMVIIPQENDDSYNSFRLLENIYHLLEGMTEEIEVAKFIKTASVPIIKIQCTRKYNEKKIDITFRDENHNGLESVALIKQYLSIYPQLKPLTLILKKFIYSARLFDPYSGGISSYGLILMVVAYLQNQNRQRKKHKLFKSQNIMISELLIGFLRFYGFKCNYIGKKICVMHPDRAKMEMEAKNLDAVMDPIYVTVMDVDQVYNNDWQPRAKLVILDPLNENNNIGRATHKIREIRTAFQMAYVCIHTNKQCPNKKKCESYKRIRENVEPGIRYQGNRRPCCILRRMMLSANTILTS